MVSTRDIDMMEKDIKNIILDMRHTINISNLKPIAQQTNWNSLMREVTGTPLYNTFNNIPVDIVEHPRSKVNNDLAGDRVEGKCRISIPADRFTIDGGITSIYLPQSIYDSLHVLNTVAVVIDNDTIITIDSDSNRTWRLQSMFYRIGEVILEVIPRVSD